jgi:hypothetical protein
MQHLRIEPKRPPDGRDSILFRLLGRALEKRLGSEPPSGYADQVTAWLVEFGDDGSAVREVGLDDRGEPIRARGLPDYGVFAGEFMIEDFDGADNVTVIAATTFESAWHRASDLEDPN